MTGWLIYDKEGAERNAWFIQAFLAEAEKHGVALLLKILSKTEKAAKEELAQMQDLPNFVIVRTMNPAVQAFFEKRRIPTFNNYKTSKVANDKWETYLLCQELNVPTMYAMKLKDYEKQGGMSYPFVLKSFNGHGGTEVFLIHNKAEYERQTACIKKENYLVQEVCSNVGIDMRVYVLGGEVLQAMIRKSEKDFRSNFSLGGSATVGEINEKQRETIRKICNALQCDFVGIDFISHHGEWVLNEIEDVVGTRMLYRYTKINPIEQYFEYIFTKLEEFYGTSCR